eukprot:7429737-Ditylum_brightwellii.AAC.1
MPGIAKQSNTEARQLAFTAEETHNKCSASRDSVEEREKSSASKFAMRKLSIQKGSAQRMIESLPNATNIAKDRNTKSWTINKLRFSAVGLLGRNNETDMWVSAVSFDSADGKLASSD